MKGLHSFFLSLGALLPCCYARAAFWIWLFLRVRVFGMLYARSTFLACLEYLLSVLWMAHGHMVRIMRACVGRDPSHIVLITIRRRDI